MSRAEESCSLGGVGEWNDEFGEKEDADTTHRGAGHRMVLFSAGIWRINRWTV